MASNRRGNRKWLKLPTKILCDTNFLLIPLRYKVDIFNETDDAVNDTAKFYVSTQVIDEIKTLKMGAKPGFARELSFALQMAEKCHIIEDDSSLLVDDSLIELAKKHEMVIGTIDKELRKKARSEGVPVIYLRQGRRLLLDGKD